MAAVPEDEESLLASGQQSEDFSRGFGKKTRWQSRYPSLFQHRWISTMVAIFMTLTTLAILFITLWMLYVYHSRAS